MSAALLLPGALAALVALLVPLIIHIARKSEQQPTDFAALRWLRQKPRPRSRLRFDEWPLLLIRLLLLALAALWLAHPVLFGAAEKRPYVAVVPGATIDSASIDKDSHTHWLAPGFPSLTDARPAGPLPVASLIRQIDAELPQGAPLTIVVPQQIDGADAYRLQLTRQVTWRIVPGTMAPPSVATPPTPVLWVRAAPTHSAALRYIRAAALAWQPSGRAAAMETALADAPLPGRNRIVVWLAGGTLPDSLMGWISRGGTGLVASDALVANMSPAAAIVWRDAQGVPLAQATRIGSGRLIRFTRPLTPAQMPALLEADFPARLRTILAPVAPSPGRVAAIDYAPTTGARAYTLPPQAMRPWLAILIAALLLAERWMATRRSRGVQP